MDVPSEYRARLEDRARWLVGIGLLLLLLGIAATIIAPIEVHAFYLFAEGGRFHYEGFGFGSFMFGFIAVQVAGYYLIALICIPLGYGHLKKRRWVRPVALTLLGTWLVAGIPLLFIVALMLFSSKELAPVAAWGTVVFMALSYLVIPGLFVRFYRSQDVRTTLAAYDEHTYWIEQIPLSVSILATLLLLYTLVLHVLLLFNGIFPVFGVWLKGMSGIALIDVSVIGLGLIIWGLLQVQRWAWWGALIATGLLTASTIVTLVQSTMPDIMNAMNLPAAEMAFLANLQFSGIHLAVLASIPLLATLVLIMFARKCF